MPVQELIDETTDRDKLANIKCFSNRRSLSIWKVHMLLLLLLPLLLHRHRQQQAALLRVSAPVWSSSASSVNGSLTFASGHASLGLGAGVLNLAFN